MDDLYDRSVEGAEFTKFCGGNLGGEHESCIEFARIPGTADGFVLHDTKPAGAGLELRATVTELDTFALGWVKQRHRLAPYGQRRGRSQCSWGRPV